MIRWEAVSEGHCSLDVVLGYDDESYYWTAKAPAFGVVIKLAESRIEALEALEEAVTILVRASLDRGVILCGIARRESK